MLDQTLGRLGIPAEVVAHTGFTAVFDSAATQQALAGFSLASSKYVSMETKNDITGLFIAHITVGGGYLQSLKYMKEVIDVIIGLIIYFSAFSLLMRDVMRSIGKRRSKKALEREGKGAKR